MGVVLGRGYSGASRNGSDGRKDVGVRAPAEVLCRKHVGDEHPVSCQVAAFSVATFRACSLCLLAHLRDTTQGRNMAETRANLNAWKLANVSEKGDSKVTAPENTQDIRYVSVPR